MEKSMRLTGIRHVITPPGSTLFKKWIEWKPNQEVTEKITNFSYVCSCGYHGVVKNHKENTFQCKGCRYTGELPLPKKKRKKGKLFKYDKIKG